MKLPIPLAFVLSITLAACVSSPPKEVRDMTFEEYQKSIGRRVEPDDLSKPKYASQEEFTDYTAWKEAGGYKESPPKKYRQPSNGPSAGEVLALASAGLQFANALNGGNQSSASAYRSTPTASQRSAGEDGWYPFVQTMGPGKGYFVINGKKYSQIILKPGNGSLAKPASAPLP